MKPTTQTDTQANKQASNQTVKKRRVFYINGFDPRGLPYFYSLYKTESQKQAQLLEYQLHIGEKDNNTWSIEYKKGATQVDTSFEYLPIDHIVQGHFTKFSLRFILRALRYYFVFFTRPSIPKKVLQLSKGALMMFLFPFFNLMLMLSILIGAPIAGFIIGESLTQSVSQSLSLSFIIGAISASLSYLLGLWLIKRIEKRTKAMWLINAFYFNLQVSEDNYDKLQLQMNDIAKHIADYIRSSDDDEIIIAGMSFGCTFLVPLMHALKPKLQLREGQTLSLLTLGQCISFVTSHRAAKTFRMQLKDISEIPMDWYDFTSPVDAACGPLTHIYQQAQVPDYDKNAPGLPKILSAQFHKMFTPEQYKALKKDFFRVHLQYLMSTELPTDYDFFTVTAAEKTLHERFKHKKSIH